MESELLAYRANPTNERFSRLYDVARPWLKSTGINTLSRYRSISISGALDDVVNEGALTLSISARRFSYFCGDCGRVFLHARDLSAHAMSEHRRRGAAGVVSLATFARTSATLAMRRTARRLVRPEWPEAEVDPGGVDDVEDRIVVEMMIDRLRERLSAGARASLELILLDGLTRGSRLEGEVEPSTALEIREAAIGLMEVNEPRKTSRRRRIMENSPEPKWSALNIRTLRESARDVLGIEASKRTMKTAYGEIRDRLLEMGKDLVFTCQNCNSLIDDRMERCWACGLVFRDGADEEEVVDAEILGRAERMGIDTEGMDRDAVVAAIEALETRTRSARRSVELLTLESRRLNEEVTAAMPDGWTKKESKQYVAYFDSGRTRRFAIMNRGLSVHFSVEDEFLDGFPDMQFFDAEARRAKHYGRTNYIYEGDTAKYALDLCKRVFREYE